MSGAVVKSKQSKRLSWLDVLKGIGIILVAIGHIYSNRTVFNWIYSFHMPLFFFAAGWVYREKSVLEDIKHRIETIIIPYFSFGFLILFYWQLIERKFRDSDMSFGNAILGLLSGEYNYLEFNVHLWFLPCFFLTVILFNVLVRLGNKYLHNGKKVAYVVVILMSMVYILVALPEMLWGFERVFKFIGFYALGTFLANRKADINMQGKRQCVQIIQSFVLICINFALSWHAMTTGIMWFVTAFVGIVGVMNISLAIKRNSILQYIGKISLLILCIHGPVYRIIVKLISILLHMRADAVRENFVLAMLVVAITLMVCSMIYNVIVQIAPWMLGRKFGACHH